MEGLKPGRIVYFVVDAFTAEQLHNVDNPPKEGDIVPAMVSRVWSDVGVNLRLFLDGPETPWVTSVSYSEQHEPRSWHWMYEGQATRGQVSGEVKSA